MIGIVVSRADSASEHIGKHLLDLADWTEETDDSRPDAEGGGTVYRTQGFELRSFDDLHLYLGGVGAAFDDPALVVFASRHSGNTGPLLTAHFTGNFGEAAFGGEDGELAEACPNALAAVLAALDEHAPDGYEVGMECTHHGPSQVSAPSMFVEVGSDEEQWADPAAARAVGRAILDLRGVDPHRPVDDSDGYRHLVWFGGGHYAPRPTRVLRETDWAIGHVVADWGLDAMADLGDETAVVRRVFERSRATRAVVQDDRPDLASLVADLGYEVVSETWVRETDGVALPLVADLEDALCPVDDGLRFGRVARESGEADAFAVVDLPADLLAEAQGIDPAATVGAVAAVSLAYETVESGNRVAGGAALPSAADREAVVDGLVAVLETRYDSVERDGDKVVATESAFDPALAREQGVPEGPAFGRLADGETIRVDDREVLPEDVHADRTRRFDV